MMEVVFYHVVGSIHFISFRQIYVNDLEVIFNSHPQFESLTESKLNNANSVQDVTEKAWRFLPADFYVNLYRLVVRSFIKYNNNSWFSHLQKAS